MPAPTEIVCASAPRPVPQVEVRLQADAPRLSLVVRDGDPHAAVAVLGLVEGGPAISAALAAIIEARLQQRGFISADSRADRDAFRVRALVSSPGQASDWVTALRAALATPLSAGSPEILLATRRLASLRRHPLAGPALSAIASCTGELGVLASEPIVDPQTPAGLSAIDHAREAAESTAQLALAVAGPLAVGEAVAGALRRAAWTRGDRAESPALASAGGAPIAGGMLRIFTDVARSRSSASVVVTMRSDRAESAVGAASALARDDAVLHARLRALPTPFRITDVAGSARPEGGCVALTLESERSSRLLEDAAALAITVTQQELTRTLASMSRLGATVPAGLSPEASFAVRSAADPRDAAERAALWAMSRPRADSGGSGDVAVAVGLPPSSVEARTSEPDAAPIAERVAQSVQHFTNAWQSPSVEHRERLEQGQAEVWVLLGSPCGTLAERESDAGWTALAITAAMSGARQDPTVAVEPWISADGVGVLAHGGRAPGETGEVAAARIAERAAQTLLARPNIAPDMADVRALALARLPDDGPGMPALAAALAPGHPSRLLPLGSSDVVARAARDAVLLRWEALVQSPLRIAVLANETLAQSEAAWRAADRWLVRTGDAAGTCSPAEVAPAMHPGAIVVTGRVGYARALIGLPVAASATAGNAFVELMLAGLSGPEGWLVQALASVGLGALPEARLLGGESAAALVIELRGSELAVENGVGQVRALLARLRQGAISADDWERSRLVRDRWAVQASLDPRRRIVDLWRDRAGPAVAASPDLRAWRAWSASALRDDQLVVVTVQPKR